MKPTPEALPPTTPRRSMQQRTILRMIRAKHGSVSRFAAAIGRNRDYVDDVIRGKETSAVIARAIAEVVGSEPHLIWPRLYAADGGPLSTLHRRLASAS